MFSHENLANSIRPNDSGRCVGSRDTLTAPDDRQQRSLSRTARSGQAKMSGRFTIAPKSGSARTQRPIADDGEARLVVVLPKQCEAVDGKFGEAESREAL